MDALGVAVALGFVVCVGETLLSFAVTPDKWEPAVVQVQVRPLLPRVEERLDEEVAEVGEEGKSLLLHEYFANLNLIKIMFRFAKFPHTTIFLPSLNTDLHPHSNYQVQNPFVYM